MRKNEIELFAVGVGYFDPYSKANQEKADFIRKLKGFQVDFGHTEVLTDELRAEYLEWVSTPEGLSYLKGGENYDEEYGRKIEEAMNGGNEDAAI